MEKFYIKKILKSENAVFHKEGITVYDIIRPLIVRGEKVDLSFHGLAVCSIQFLQACIGHAYLEFGPRVKDLLKPVEFNHIPGLPARIQDVIQNAL